jgi:hypothetical protein
LNAIAATLHTLDAIAAMLTNVATALFGLADMWAIGQLGDAAAQGAVELGAKYMLGLLNMFNFLRTGTVALTAQATGRGDAQAQAATLVRALAAAGLIGAALLAAMPLAVPSGLDLLEAHGPCARPPTTRGGSLLVRSGVAGELRTSGMVDRTTTGPRRTRNARIGSRLGKVAGAWRRSSVMPRR